MDDWDEQKPAFLPYRPLVPAAVAFACGILTRETLALPPSGVWVALCLAVAAFPAFAWFELRSAAPVALWLAVAGAGWVRLDLAGEPRGPDHISRFLGEEPTLVKLRGVVASDPEVRVLPPMPLSGDSKWLATESRQTRFDLDCHAACVDAQWRPLSGRVRVVEHEACGDPPYGYGYRVVAVGMARLPTGPSNPGQVDGSALLRRRGIDATLSVGEGGVAVEEPGGGGPWATVYALRSSLRARLRTTLAPDHRSAALLCALVLGDRTELDDDLEEAFARTGTIHLLAVSGFNVAIVAWVVWLAAALTGLGRRLAGALALCTVVAYALVSGAPPSVVRAAVMTGAFVLGIMGRRQPDAVQAVALAALVLLVLRPFDLFNAGFQLSFAAVLGIVLLSGDLRGLLRPRKSLLDQMAGDEEPSRWARWRRTCHERAAAFTAASTAAWLGVLPLGVLYFGHYNPATVLVNMVVIPLAGLLTILGFAHTLLAAASHALAWTTASATQGTASFLTGIVFFLDTVLPAHQYCAPPALGWVVAYYALGLTVVCRRRLGLSGTRAATLWVAGILAFLVFSASGRPPQGLEVTALDVQHGNATVLRFPDGSTALYDCGSYGRTDVGRWAAAPALWHWGVRTIDLLVVSHADADHINGIPALLDRFRVGRVVHSPVLGQAEAGRQLLDLLRERGIPASPVQAGDRIVVGNGNALDVLWPMDWSLRLRPNDQNENSLVLRIEHAGRRVLLGGDIERVGATVLLHSGLDLRADVLLTPHHGCANPFSEQLARAVRPSRVICSNRAEHLPPATVAAYEAVGAQVLATCREGAITARIRHGEVEAVGWKKPTGP